MNNEKLILKCFALLRKETPLSYDCGKICDGNCCKGDNNTGMLLFPGEENILSHSSYKILDENDSSNGKILICDGKCSRDMRPLACRIYPLFPFISINEDDEIKVSVIYDPRARQNCPLAHFNKRLNVKFVRAVRRVGKILIRDKEMLDFLLSISNSLSEIDELKKKLFVEE